jgi:hypothetical protein
MTEKTVPRISLADLGEGLHDNEFRRSVGENGVFYLAEHGVSDEDRQLATDVAMDFFQHSTAEQRRAVTTNVPTMRALCSLD